MSTRNALRRRRIRGLLKRLRPGGGSRSLSQIVELIRSEVAGLEDAWVKSGVDQVRTADYRTYLMTLSTMSHVQASLSPGRYWTLRTRGAVPTNTEECLSASAGICGNQAQAMLDVLRELGCQARPVGLYYMGALGTAASHAAIEVAWGGRWHFVDVGNGTIFRAAGEEGPNLLSVNDLLATREPKRHAVVNASKPELQMTLQFVGDPLDYLVSDPDVVLDGEGIIRLRALHQGDQLVYELQDVPKYVGAVPASDGGYATLRMILPITRPVDRIDVSIASVAGDRGSLRVRSHAGNWESVLTPGTTVVTLPARAVSGNIELSVASPDGTACCAILSAISARLVRGAA